MRNRMVANGDRNARTLFQAGVIEVKTHGTAGSSLRETLSSFGSVYQPTPKPSPLRGLHWIRSRDA